MNIIILLHVIVKALFMTMHDDYFQIQENFVKIGLDDSIAENGLVFPLLRPVE